MRTAEIIVFEPDLMFASRIEGAATNAGVGVKFVNDLHEMVEQLRRMTPQTVILNLDAAEGKLDGLEPLVKNGPFKTIGYYSHVNTRLAEDAKRIGIGIVLSRGAFTARLGQILRELRLS